MAHPTSRSTFARRLATTVGPTLVLALGVGVVASAQSSSPFASKKKKQAWEVDDAPVQTAPAPTQPAATQSYPAQSYPAPSYPAQSYPAPSYPAQSAPAPSYPSATPASPSTQSPNSYPQEPQWGAPYGASSSTAPSVDSYSGGADPQYAGQPQYSNQPQHSNQQAPSAPTYGGQAGYGSQPDYGQAPIYPQYRQGPQAPAGNRAPMQQAPRSWSQRLGLDKLSTIVRGGLRGGVAARETDGWTEAFVGDADLEFEVSAVTDGGLEYGLNLQGRAQYDENRRGFARRLPDCPPTQAGCASVLVDGAPVALRGHTSQFYSFGPDTAKDTQVALESAHLFLRSAYGDVTIGRDDGAAYLFSLGAPTLLNVGASNSPVDYTGLDAVKTVNDASGFAEKITYTTPRLLGDRIGVGVQLGVSYALDAKACGVDYCVEPNGIAGVLAPDIEDVVEVGLSLDRTFAGGLSVEATGTYARGTEVSGVVGLDDLESYGAGIEVKLSDWTAGGSWLQSNQGVLGGDYEAYDVGLTWKPGPLGFTLGYGHATDDLVNLSSDQITGGVSYDWNDNITIGAGVQYSDRESLREIGGVATVAGESATAIFIEGGITF